jgi:hypothetical protein
MGTNDVYRLELKGCTNLKTQMSISVSRLLVCPELLVAFTYLGSSSDVTEWHTLLVDLSRSGGGEGILCRHQL